MLRSLSARAPRRRGAVLLVVLSMITLFAILALSFALFAESEATAARIHRESENVPADDLPQPIDYVSAALGQVIYDVSDFDPVTSQSSFRGYSLARQMYGYDPTTIGNNLSPYAGRGLITDTDDTNAGNPSPYNALPVYGNVYRSGVVNFAVQPGTNVIFDREYTGYRTAVGSATAAAGTTRVYQNVAGAYTYPDLKDMYLAVLDTTTSPNIGRVLQPSFHRFGPAWTPPSPPNPPMPQWVFNASESRPEQRLAPPQSGYNLDWGLHPPFGAYNLNAAGRLRILRPRPIDHFFDSGDGRGPVTDFPYPTPNADGTFTGDVQNFPNPTGIQRNDSLWMYPAGPIRTWNGKKYTALVATLILDMNGRVNIATAGNNRKGFVTTYMAGPPATTTQTPGDHASAIGVGPWEVNPTKVLDPTGIDSTTAANTLRSLLSGGTFQTNSIQANIAGRYGVPSSVLPPADTFTQNTIALLNGGWTPPQYALVDYDANGLGAADRFNPVGGGTSPFPSFTTSRFNYAAVSANDGRVTETADHPSQYKFDSYQTRTQATTGLTGRTFSYADLRRLAARFGDDPVRTSMTDPARLAPQKLLAGPATTIPADPMNPITQRFNPSAPAIGPITVGSGPLANFPTGAFNTLNPNIYEVMGDPAYLARLLTTTHSASLSRPELILNTIPPVAPATTPVIARLGPIDVNRTLPDYRSLKDMNQYLPAPAAPMTPNPNYLQYYMYGPDNVGNRNLAQASRQRMARDIFVRLVAIADDWRLTQPAPNNTKVIDGTNIGYVSDPTAQDYGYFRFVGAGGVATAAQIAYLRPFAQAAVNVVDYLDPDDVSTTFTWNPVHTSGFLIETTNGTWLPNMITPAPQPATPPAGFTYGVLPAAEIGNHVVYGAELPKVAINEVYAEVTNNRQDYNPNKGINGPPMVAGKQPATQNFEKRYWVELFNGIRSDSTQAENGYSRLYYPTGTFGLAAGYAPYMLVVSDYSAGAIDDSANVTGSPRHATAAAATPLLVLDKYDFDGTDSAIDNNLIAPAGVIDETYAAASPYPIKPAVASTPNVNIQQYVIQPHTGAGTGTKRSNVNGFFVLGPVEDFPGQNTASPFSVDVPVQATIRVKSQKSANGMDTAAMQLDTGTKLGNMLNAAGLLKPQAIYLRRLANPYVAPNDPLEPNFNAALPINPYITVDRVENVTANKNVRFDDQGATMPAITPTVLSGEATQVKVHPFAATTLAAETGTSTQSPQHSFFEHNRNAAVNTGSSFAWLTHLDRNAIHALELAHVSAYAPHQATQNFFQGGGYNRHTIERLLMPRLTNGANPMTWNPSLTMTDGAMYKALDFLTTGSAISGTPVGGREHGRININTAWHQQVLKALLDANDSNYFLDTDVASMWTNLTTDPGAVTPLAPPATANARTPNFPNVTLNPSATADDKPIWATHAMDASLSSTPAQLFNDNLQRTLLRTYISQPPAASPPVFNNPNVAPAGASDPSHVAVVAEPVRKMWNSTTTTSNTFLVLMTVGYFEVRGTTASGQAILGKELFKSEPGDLRAKFAAVVDRTSLGFDANLTLQAPELTWFTTLAEDLQPGDTTMKVVAATTNLAGAATVPTDIQVPVNGQFRSVMGRALMVGFGDGTQRYLPTPQYPANTPNPNYDVNTNNNGDGERITTVAAPVATMPATPLVQQATWANGIGTVNLAYAATKYHPAGSPVSNLLLGNPGPQKTFDANSSRYSGVVPYFVQTGGRTPK